MFLGSLHRTILIDLFRIFAVALVALTGLILLAGVITEAMKNGLGPLQILTAIPLLLPSMLPYTVPTTTLFATCIVYGRLAADNEILAIKAAGVHIIHVVWPALFLGTFAGALTMWLSLDAIPYTHFLLRTTVVNDVEDLLYAMLRRDGCFRHPQRDYELYVKNIQGRKLLGAQFMRRAAHGGGFDMIARPREAELFVDRAQKQILLDMRQCQFIQGNGTVGFLESRVVPIELPGELMGVSMKARATDMIWKELGRCRRDLSRDKVQTSQDIDAHQLAISQGRAPPNFTQHVRDKINERKLLDSQIFAIDTEVHMRPAFAFGCLCFALVGCPIGIWFSKTDYLSAFVTCFLPIVTVYYPLMFCTINMARAGKILPWMAIYDADGIMLVAGLLLFRRLARH